MVSSPKAPPAPDPIATAGAQSASNVATATANQTMNMVDQYTPDGSLKYDWVQNVDIPNGLGGTMSVPRYQATQTLSPAQKALQGVTDQTEMNLATIGRDQSAKIGGILGTNVNLDNEAVEGRLMELGSKRLDPRFAREEEALRTRLVNQGLRPGTAAFDAEMGNFSQGRNDAYNQLALQGRGQAVQEILTERNQPLNEISALMSGSQVSMPSFVNSPQTQVGGTDYQGAVYNSYQGQMDAYKQKVASNNAMLGGLFGLAGNLGGMAVYKSDRRLKRDIVQTGHLPNGLPTYLFRYLDSDEFFHGLMSDDVRKVIPKAVIVMPDGFDAVDYHLAMRA